MAWAIAAPDCAPLCAQDAITAAALPRPIVSTSESPAYSQVSATSADPLAVADTLQLATDTRDQLASLLELGAKWRFAVHIHILTPDDPLTAKINREAAAVFAQGTTMKLEAVVPSSDPLAREFIQRQFVTALLWEKFFAKTKHFDHTTKLDVVPVWLIEGLREWLNEDDDRDRESIVRRAVHTSTAPTLAEVTGWQSLSSDRLLGLWQRAFCFYLVDSLIQPGTRRADFQQWLSNFSEDPSSSGTSQVHFPTETAWQHELADAVSRSRAIIYTWDETQNELASKETISFAESKDSKIQTCTLDTCATLPPSKMLTEALHERIFVLTELELRAHPSWHDVLETYRAALTALVTDNNAAKATELFQKAHKLRVAEVAYHQKLVDYVNWFEVTKNYGDPPHFQNYFDTAEEMERIEADPKHPNPIRANLLQIESEL